MVSGAFDSLSYVVQPIRERPQIIDEVVLDVIRSKHEVLPKHPVRWQLDLGGLEGVGSHCVITFSGCTDVQWDLLQDGEHCGHRYHLREGGVRGTVARITPGVVVRLAMRRTPQPFTPVDAEHD